MQHFMTKDSLPSLWGNPHRVCFYMRMLHMLIHSAMAALVAVLVIKSEGYFCASKNTLLSWYVALSITNSLV